MNSNTQSQTIQQIPLKQSEIKNELIPEVRIGVGGNIDAGKSTFVGVMTKNVLDNGRGFARAFIMRYKHEIESGRTSAIIQHYIRNTDKIIEFTDLAGHEKYLKTTMNGIGGCLLDYIAIVINANTGIQQMTREHIGLVYSLRLPMFIIYTKTDLCPPNIYQMNLDFIKSYYSKKMGLETKLISNEEDLNSITNGNLFTYGSKIVPIFPLSNVSGTGVDLVKTFIQGLKTYVPYSATYNKDTNFIVSRCYVVNGIGFVLSGVMKRGSVKKGDILYLGPNADGFVRDIKPYSIQNSSSSSSSQSSSTSTTNSSASTNTSNSTQNSTSSSTTPITNNYYKVVVKGIHNNFRESVDVLYAGQSGCLNIKPIGRTVLKRNMIKTGMRLLNVINSVRQFDAKIKVLHNPTTITSKYQPTIHCEGISQNVKIVKMDKEFLRSFDEANVTFKFMYKPEFIEKDSIFIFREGLTKGIGKIINVY